MKPFELNIDKNKIANFILTNSKGMPSEDFSKSSMLSANAARIAQQLRRVKVGDAENLDKMIEDIEKDNPLGYYYLRVESEHLKYAESRNMIFVLAHIGKIKDRDVDKNFNSIIEIQNLYNEGINLIEKIDNNEDKNDLNQLLDALKRELIHAEKIYGNRPCFVATVVYESTNNSQVIFLRKIRDTYLIKIEFGRLLLRFYYSGFGEKASRFLNKNKLLIPVFRNFLNFIIWFFRIIYK